VLSHGRQLSLERQYSAFERLGADESMSDALLGPLPPPHALQVPIRRVGSTLYAERRLAREYVLKASPVLFHTESWLETLLTPREWVPPSILYFVIVAVRAPRAGQPAPLPPPPPLSLNRRPSRRRSRSSRGARSDTPTRRRPTTACTRR
jgi:hypothetical protein